jgi:small-conductance mechanosensitive channel
MLTVIVAVIGVAMVLLLHPTFRVLGTGILASAGFAGIVIGIAAQQPVRNLLAGIQIAITQPFRVDDVVIVEGEWGQIEEITLTYVVVRIWDLRRLVLPIGYFLEKPFQNWTRTSSSILGTAFLHLDYSAPIEELRTKLTEIAEASPLWDRRVCVLQVTELKERTMELRALVSASNAGRAWDLRCEVREKLITFLKEEHPDALPRMRGEIRSFDPPQPESRA